MRTLHDQRGLAFIVEIILGAAALTVIGIGVYVAFNVKKPSGQSLMPGKIMLNSKCDYNDSDLCRFLNNWKIQDSYTARSTQTTKDGTTEYTIIISGKGNSQLITKTNGKETWNTIGIGNTTYTKDFSDNQWWKQTVEPDKAQAPQKNFDFTKDDSSNASSTTQKTQFKSLGKAACGPLQCFKYQVIEPGQTVTSYIYFDDRDYLLRKMEDTDSGSTSTIEFSYDKIIIKEPAPVKAAEPGQVILPNGETFVPPTVPDSIPDATQ